MRLDQFLSARTMYSRRELRQMIQKGKVTVDGVTVKKPDQAVKPEQNRICLGDRHIPGDLYLYVLLHKPKGYVSSADEPGQKSVLETSCSSSSSVICRVFINHPVPAGLPPASSVRHVPGTDGLSPFPRLRRAAH